MRSQVSPATKGQMACYFVTDNFLELYHKLEEIEGSSKVPLEIDLSGAKGDNR